MNARGTTQLVQVVMAAAVASGLVASQAAWGGALDRIERTSLDTGLFARTFGTGEEPLRVGYRGGELADRVRNTEMGMTDARLGLPLLDLPSFANKRLTSFNLSGMLINISRGPSMKRLGILGKDREKTRGAFISSLSTCRGRATLPHSRLGRCTCACTAISSPTRSCRI